MNIGQAAKAAGVTPKMIRHYEATGLLPAAVRTATGYRVYGEADIRALRFIRQARALGFPLADLGGLLRLWHDRDRASADVKALALSHIAHLQERIDELQAMKQTLETLARHCQGDDSPHCAILDGLEQRDGT
jgi:MerR family copper efflux transcriptional regulator